MSETQVNKTSPISGAPQPAPSPTPPPASAMPNLAQSPQNNPVHNTQNAVPTVNKTPQPEKTSNSNTASNTPFTFDSTKNTPKSAQRPDHFAEQNQKRIAKKAENRKRSKRAAIILGIILGFVALGLIIWLIITLIPESDNTFVNPEILPSNMEDLKNEADRIYQDTGNLDSANQLFQNTIDAIENTTNDSTQQTHINQVYWTQFLFYAENLENEKLMELAPEINPDLLDDYQKLSYYNLLYQASYALGDSEAQERYFNLFTTISDKIYGEIGE